MAYVDSQNIHRRTSGKNKDPLQGVNSIQMEENMIILKPGQWETKEENQVSE